MEFNILDHEDITKINYLNNNFNNLDNIQYYDVNTREIFDLEGGGLFSSAKGAISDAKANLKKSLKQVKNKFLKVKLNSFKNDYYDVVDSTIDSFYQTDKKARVTYEPTKLRATCEKNIAGQKRLNYIDGKILKYLLKAEIVEAEKREEEYNFYLEQKTIAVKNKKPLPPVIEPFEKSDWIVLCDGTCVIDKVYINTIVDNIIDTLNQLSLTTDFDSRSKAQQDSRKIALIVTMVVISMSIASFGFGGIFVVLSFVAGLASKVVSASTATQIIDNDTKFVRDKYTFDRFNLHTTNSLSKTSYLKLQDIDKAILNLAQKYNPANKAANDKLIFDVLSLIKDLHVFIDLKITEGVPTIATPYRKKKVKSYIATLTVISDFYKEYDQYEIVDEKIIYILNDFSKYILDRNTRATIEEDLANAINKYNNIDINSTTFIDYGREEDLEYADGLKTTVLVLLHEYLSLLDNTTGKSMDLPKELLGDKIDILSGLDKNKLTTILKKILKILDINAKNELKTNLKTLNKDYSKANIEYVCNKIKQKFELKQKMSESQFVNLITDIKEMFLNFKKNINDIGDDEELANVCVDLKFDKKNPSNKDIKINKVKKIKEFLTKMNDVFITLDSSTPLTPQEQAEEKENEKDE
jgi:hypothetical protein